MGQFTEIIDTGEYASGGEEPTANRPNMFEWVVGAHTSCTIGPKLSFSTFSASALWGGEANFNYSVVLPFWSVYFNWTAKYAMGNYYQNIYGMYEKIIMAPDPAFGNGMDGDLMYAGAATPFIGPFTAEAAAVHAQLKDPTIKEGFGEVKLVQGTEFKWVSGKKIEKNLSLDETIVSNPAGSVTAGVSSVASAVSGAASAALSSVGYMIVAGWVAVAAYGVYEAVEEND